MSSDVPGSLWFALLAPPAAWFIALSASYFLVDWACGSLAGMIAMHGTMLAMAAAGVGAIVPAVHFWRKSGAEWPGESAEPLAWTRLLAVLAGFGGILFTLVILWFWIAALVVSPCEPGPRLPLAPSAATEARSLGGSRS